MQEGQRLVPRAYDLLSGKTELEERVAATQVRISRFERYPTLFKFLGVFTTLVWLATIVASAIFVNVTFVPLLIVGIFTFVMASYLQWDFYRGSDWPCLLFLVIIAPFWPASFAFFGKEKLQHDLDTMRAQIAEIDQRHAAAGAGTPYVV